MRIHWPFIRSSIAGVLLLHAIPLLASEPAVGDSKAAVDAGDASISGADSRQRAVTSEAGDAQLVSDVQAPPSAETVVSAVANEEGPSAAERIARLKSAIAADQTRLDELRAGLDAPDSEYVKAEADFRELDQRQTAMQQRLAELEKADQRDALAQLQRDAAVLRTKWTLAKERFDLAIGERKAMQESVATLERKIEGEVASLAKLKGGDLPQPLTAPQPANPQPAHPQPAQLQPARPLPLSDGAAAPPTQEPQDSPPNPPARMPPPGASATDPAPGAGNGEAAPNLTPKIAKELAVANEAAQKSLAAVKAAEDEERSITDRIDILARDIALQRQLRNSARKTVDNSEKTLHNLNEDLLSKLMSGESIDEVRKQIAEASSRLHDNRIKAQAISTRLDELQTRLAQLQAEQLLAANDLTRKQAAAQRDRAIVERLRNPFTLRNLLQWLIDHGPRIVSILVFLAIFMWLSRVCEARLVELTAKRGRRGSREERENRAKTLLGVFHNVANIAIIVGGGMMILDEIGVPVAPIIGGAAVFGLAVAFGAQSLIKDYFVGFMVLLEQQYLVNDVVEIGSIKGQVERVSLRITVLRDLEGRVHFIPHSQINSVTNMTHGWSRAVFEIGVAYKESVDHVIRVLTALAEELRRDENYRLLILNDPVMLGVDAFSSSAVVIKFYIQTRPLQQWTVKRELLRRIKNEFDRQGIEIPFPHMTIYRGIGRSDSQIDHDRSGDWQDRNVA